VVPGLDQLAVLVKAIDRDAFGRLALLAGRLLTHELVLERAHRAPADRHAIVGA
jgi:hypothetical protein